MVFIYLFVYLFIIYLFTFLSTFSFKFSYKQHIITKWRVPQHKSLRNICLWTRCGFALKPSRWEFYQAQADMPDRIVYRKPSIIEVPVDGVSPPRLEKGYIIERLSPWLMGPRKLSDQEFFLLTSANFMSKPPIQLRVHHYVIGKLDS